MLSKVCTGFNPAARAFAKQAKVAAKKVHKKKSPAKAKKFEPIGLAASDKWTQMIREEIKEEATQPSTSWYL